MITLGSGCPVNQNRTAGSVHSEPPQMENEWSPYRTHSLRITPFAESPSHEMHNFTLSMGL